MKCFKFKKSCAFSSITGNGSQLFKGLMKRQQKEVRVVLGVYFLNAN